MTDIEILVVYFLGVIVFIYILLDVVAKVTSPRYQPFALITSGVIVGVLGVYLLFQINGMKELVPHPSLWWYLAEVNTILVSALAGSLIASAFVLRMSYSRVSAIRDMEERIAAIDEHLSAWQNHSDEVRRGNDVDSPANQLLHNANTALNRLDGSRHDLIADMERALSMLCDEYNDIFLAAAQDQHRVRESLLALHADCTQAVADVQRLLPEDTVSIVG